MIILKIFIRLIRIHGWQFTRSVAIFASLILAGCSLSPLTPAADTPTDPLPTAFPTPTGEAVQTPLEPGVVWDLVVIGDSSLWGLGSAYARRIEMDTGVQVNVIDLTVLSLEAKTILDALETGESSSARLKHLPDTIREAELVVMWANPNRSVNPEHPLGIGPCFNGKMPGACDTETLTVFVEHLKGVWAKIIELRAGAPTILRAVDFYSTRVGVWQKNGVFDACTACWISLCNAPRIAAEAYGVPFLSRYDAFNGIDHTVDAAQKGLIREDGQHPSNYASQYTADLLGELGYSPLVAP